ncbi:response regulator transcription factor [Spartinivicinus poritis]|uniref:Response regulator transcription factor n=1 Tax=Spartinivicinus poritis TaxID=2994640 RepID=A0ABT5U6V5_9GAMM|nr:response regulator transcription factor [Spartinivicinus sp. A2-2]MDE1460904.1 response regulator transcription factor [Spartinivicinus sp. A2-2]
MRLLVVDDNHELLENTTNELRQAGFAVDTCDNGVDALHQGQEENYAAVVLDLGLPDINGLTILQEWRSRQNTVPVIILTARGEWYERVEGLQAGADDYVSKPFYHEELIARLRAVICRYHGHNNAALQLGDINLDEEKQQLDYQGKHYKLTAMEFRLLRYFMLNPGKVLSKQRLTEQLYEYDADKDSNVLEVYIAHLRRKLGKASIETRRGQGYIFHGSTT